MKRLFTFMSLEKYKLKSKWDTITITFPLETVVVVPLLTEQLFATLWTAACQASISCTISWSLLKLISWVSDWPYHSLSPLFFSSSQYFPESGSFPMSWLFISGGQNIGVSASAPALPIQGWFPLGLTGFILLLSKGLSRVFSEPQFESINFSALGLHYGSTLTSVRDYWKKPQLWLYGHLSAKWHLSFLKYHLGLS